LVETPAFQKVVDTGEVAKLPLARVFKTSWYQIILGTFIMLATYVLFYLMTAFTLTYGTTAASEASARAAAEKAGKAFDPSTFVPGLGYSRNEFLIMLIVGVVFFGVFTLVAGPLAERYGRRKTLIWVTLGIVVFGLLFVPLFGGGFVGTMALLIVGFTLMGLTFGPMGATLPELFPTNVRYTGSAISYNLSSVLGAAVAPTVAVWLWTVAHGSTVWVGVYLSGAGILTLIALFLSKETKDIDFNENVS
ncbi:MAG: MFS transporter, partial [Leifsonia sp.]